MAKDTIAKKSNPRNRLVKGGKGQRKSLSETEYDFQSPAKSKYKRMPHIRVFARTSCSRVGNGQKSEEKKKKPVGLTTAHKF